MKTLNHKNILGSLLLSLMATCGSEALATSVAVSTRTDGPAVPFSSERMKEIREMERDLLSPIDTSAAVEEYHNIGAVARAPKEADSIKLNALIPLVNARVKAMLSTVTSMRGAARIRVNTELLRPISSFLKGPTARLYSALREGTQLSQAHSGQDRPERTALEEMCSSVTPENASLILKANLLEKLKSIFEGILSDQVYLEEEAAATKIQKIVRGSAGRKIAVDLDEAKRYEEHLKKAFAEALD